MNRLNADTFVKMQPQHVTVKTTARLHMGFVDLNGSQSRKFGSLGVALDKPATHLTVSTCKKPLSAAHHPNYVVKIIENLSNQLKLGENFSVEIHESIPEHAGLGSGTQMALAIGAGLNTLFDLNFSAAQLAEITSRGRRSGIGIGTFAHGGLVLDGGRNMQHPNRLPPIIARHDFPTDWPILLMMDNSDQGVFGEAEAQAFERLPQADLATAQALSHHVLMQALPAIIEHDYAQFSQAIHALQLATGAYFAPAQGGHYKSAKVAEVLGYLNQQGIICAGQSSWGPTGFAVFEHASHANLVLNQLQQRFFSSNLHFQLAHAKNTGADIRLNAHLVC